MIGCLNYEFLNFYSLCVVKTVMRRIRKKRLLKLMSIFLCFLALSWIGFYLVGPNTPPYADTISQFQPMPGFNDYEKLQLADLTTKNIDKKSSTAKKTLILVVQRNHNVFVTTFCLRQRPFLEAQRLHLQNHSSMSRPNWIQ